MKKVYLLLILAVVGVLSINAQEKGRVRGGIDFGYCAPKGGGGIAVDLNLGYNIADNMNVGVKYASAVMGKTIKSDGISVDADLKATSSYLGTFNYYFNSGKSSFAPFVGCGLGYYALGNLKIADLGSDVSVDGKFGGLLTTGFEAGKFKLGVEYNIVPSTKVESATVTNSYLVVSLGFYFGGGRWKK